jgi:hypothetical protein
MVSLDQCDPTFAKDLKSSSEAVAVAARWLADELKFTVVIPPVRCRPDVSQRAAYADKGDLFIQQPIEVKRRSFCFHSLEDYKKKYLTAIVDNCHAWDKANPKPHAFLLFSNDLTGFLLCKGSTRPHWLRTSGFQKERGRVREVYECPVELCEYKKIVGPIVDTQ